MALGDTQEVVLALVGALGGGPAREVRGGPGPLSDADDGLPRGRRALDPQRHVSGHRRVPRAEAAAREGVDGLAHVLA